VPFISEMDKAYAWADVVLCRAGASTVAELCAAGLGAILVPFPHAVDDHQTANANFMVKGQAAILIQQADLTETILAKVLQEWCQSKDRCRAMGAAAYQLRQVDATEKVVAICEEMSQ
jgi:UDP-N-acetylglucosamine--N-acetylmuramyl-(pentapeptide) pyrophosphoryl-undecaprenol N-acetylglucosamine transferase